MARAIFHLFAVMFAVMGALLGTAIVPCYSDAIVGAVRTVHLPIRGSVSDAEIRTSYKRPTTIPFPADNPYTVQRIFLERSSISTRAFRAASCCHARRATAPVTPGPMDSRQVLAT
jgi:hypothetical protein